jgi:hypothetical protein
MSRRGNGVKFRRRSPVERTPRKSRRRVRRAREATAVLEANRLRASTALPPKSAQERRGQISRRALAADEAGDG